MSYLLAFFLLLIPLVVVHELGHFVMAKLSGISVRKFAFGYGQKLVSFHFKGTEYCWNLLPLGGYVDFMGDAVLTMEQPDDPNHFFNRSKSVRFWVLVMGPVFNFLLAFLLFWLLFAQPNREIILFGDPVTVGFVEPESVEQQAGLRPGDVIRAVNDQSLTQADELYKALALAPNKTVTLHVEREGTHLEIPYKVPADPRDGNGIPRIHPAIRLVVSRVEPDSPADRAGLQADDVIQTVDGQPVFFGSYHDETRDRDVTMLTQVLMEAESLPTTLTVLRGEERVETQVQPEPDEDDLLLVGIQVTPESRWVDPDMWSALDRAWGHFLDNSVLVITVIKKLLYADLPFKSLSGAPGIAKHAKDALDQGFLDFVYLMAILSLQLGIINLVPIPVLDGGEIFVLGVEWIARRDFSLDTKFRIKMVGFVALVMLMVAVLVSDVLKFISA